MDSYHTSEYGAVKAPYACAIDTLGTMEPQRYIHNVPYAITDSVVVQFAKDIACMPFSHFKVHSVSWLLYTPTSRITILN